MLRLLAEGTSASLKYPYSLATVELSAKEAYEVSGYGPWDMDLVQAYDTVAPSELWDMGKLGFCRTGEAAHLLREGVFDGLTGVIIFKLKL